MQYNIKPVKIEQLITLYKKLQIIVSLLKIFTWLFSLQNQLHVYLVTDPINTNRAFPVILL